jgi:hypothetical protein
MLDIFSNASIDRREEIVLAILAVVIPLTALPSMLGF